MEVVSIVTDTNYTDVHSHLTSILHIIYATFCGIFVLIYQYNLPTFAFLHNYTIFCLLFMFKFLFTKFQSLLMHL